MIRAAEICGWELSNLSQNLRYTLTPAKLFSHWFLWMCLYLITWCWLTLLQIKPSYPVKDPETRRWCVNMDKSPHLDKPNLSNITGDSTASTLQREGNVWILNPVKYRQLREGYYIKYSSSKELCLAKNISWNKTNTEN